MASPGRSRDQKRVVWSLEAVTRRWPSGWKAIDQTLESWAWDRVARGEEVVCAKEGSGAARSQCMTAPSEPPETRRGWTGCHVTATGPHRKYAFGGILAVSTHSRLPSCGLLRHGTLSWRGYQIRGRSDLERRWQPCCHSVTMPGPGQCFCAGDFKPVSTKYPKVDVGTYSVESTVPVRGSQNLMRLSLLPDTSSPFVGCHSTHLTSQPWPIDINERNIKSEMSASLTSQGAFHATLLESPDTNGRVVTGCCESTVVRAKTKPPDSFSMAIPSS